MAATCKKCNTEMDKVYCFGEGIPYQQWKCPQCKAATAKRTIAYNDKGNPERKGGKILND